MASRPVTLLKKGYFSGRLDFKYPHPYSRVREKFILNEIEKEEYLELIKLRVVLDAQSIPLNPKGAKAVYEVLEDYLGISLPYMNKGAKIKGMGKASTEENKAYFAELREKQKAKLAELKKKKEQKENK